MKKSLWVSLLLLATMLIVPAACKAPAEFQVNSLDVMPSEVTAGKPVSITAEVKNVGGSEGTYNAILTVDGVQVETKNVAVAPGASEMVTFSLVRDTPRHVPGRHWGANLKPDSKAQVGS